MPKKKKSAAKASVASNAKTTRVADTTESADAAINEKIIRLFACRMGTSLAKSVIENDEKSHDSSSEETRCEDDDENKDNLQKMDSFFEKNAFSIECDEKHKESIKCLLQSKVTLSAKRCLKECVCDICDCEDCKRKILERRMKEAEKNATSLIAEEERKKKKLEKKKSQKKKRKQQKKVDDERSKSDKQIEIVNKQLGTLMNKELHINEKKSEAFDNGSITQKNKKLRNENRNSKQKVIEKPSTPSVPSSSDEEELNLNSAFVADIAQRKSKASSSAITNKSPFVEPQYTLDFEDSDYTVDETDSQDSQIASQSNSYQKHNEQKSNGYVEQNLNIESSFGFKCEDGVRKSVDIGAQANKEALNKNFALAVEMFKKAIELNPSDYRFYVNRSYCYDCLLDYENALKDAETAISLNSVWPKCYYRKGRALSGLRRFEEAETAFNKVLELEKFDCNEATSELIRVREEAVRQLGYDKQIASAAAAKYNSVREAIYSVVNCLFNVTRQHNDECDSEDELILNANLNYPSIAEKTPNDVTNPFGWKALWVGNLSPNADESVLQRMFCKYGVLSHCGLYKRPEGAFALVHYDNSESPRRAMAAYQGTVIKGISLRDEQKLILRFRPNRDQKQDKYQERIDTPECYYWRTTGCLRVEDCHFLHIPANKGVDIQPWMITSDGKPRNPNQRITKK